MLENNSQLQSDYAINMLERLLLQLTELKVYKELLQRLHAVAYVNFLLEIDLQASCSPVTSSSASLVVPN